ncbi:MAG: GNAT family protein [Syntrophales bacterium]
MIRTREYLLRQKETLLRAHPDLREIRVVTVQEAGWDHRQASAFIESCWRDYYRAEESRVVFSPEFLEWQLPELHGICALDRDGRPAGCLVAFPRSYRMQGRDGVERFTLGSCLSILPNLRGRGIAQLMVLAVQELDMENGRSFSCCYIDRRKSGSGSSYRIWGTPRSRAYSLSRISLLAKAFDWRKARTYGRLNFLATAVVRGAQKLFPSRRGRAFPNGLRVHAGSGEHLPAVRELLDAADRSLPARRVYGDAELTRMIVFRKNTFHALSYVLLDEQGRADGFLFGYRLPVGERDSAYFADGVVFRPGLPYRLRRSFLSECEGRLRDGEGCVGLTLLSTASPENLLKYGYVPYDSQIRGMDLYVGTGLTPRNLSDLRIELR